MEAGELGSVPRYVGIGPRAGAALIDGILIGLVFGIPLLLSFGDRTTSVGASGTTTTYSTSEPRVSAIWVVLGLAYYIVFEATVGATIGKLILNLRVRHLDGSRIGWNAAIIRNISRLVDGFPYVIPYLVGAFMMWGDDERQRLGDGFAGTSVRYK